MNSNLLDLNNDILNIIGDYVKKDNIDDDKCNEIMKIFNEYLTLKKLNLKNKKYSFGKNCIKEKNILKNLKLFNDL